jgi:thioredoxin-related protein
VQIYTDIVPIPSITAAQRLELAQSNQELLIDIAQEATNPIYVVMDAEGKVLERVGGYNEPTAFVAFLSRALGKFSPTKMAAN